MKIGVILNEFSSPAEVARLGELAESYGISTVWTENYPNAPDPFLALTPLAARTTRIEIAPMAVSPFEMHPIKIGNALFTLDELSGGRAAILIGGGGGIASMIERPIARTDQAVRECVEIIRAARQDRPVMYAGEIFSVQGWVAQHLRPPRPPLYIGANGPRMRRMAAEVGDGIMMGDMPLVLLPDMIDSIRADLRACDRSADGYRIDNFLAWHIQADADAAYRESRRELYLRGLLQPMWLNAVLDEADARLAWEKRMAFKMAFRRRTHVIEGVPDRIIDTLIEHLSLTGGMDELDRAIDKLKAYAAGGLTDISLRLHDDQEAAIRLIGEAVVPALR